VARFNSEQFPWQTHYYDKSLLRVHYEFLLFTSSQNVSQTQFHYTLNRSDSKGGYKSPVARGSFMIWPAFSYIDKLLGIMTVWHYFLPNSTHRGKFYVLGQVSWGGMPLYRACQNTTYCPYMYTIYTCTAAPSVFTLKIWERGYFSPSYNTLWHHYLLQQFMRLLSVYIKYYILTTCI